MLGADLPDLAVRGEGGIDVFLRMELPDQRRARFRCIGRLPDPDPVAGPDPAPEAYERQARRNPDRLRRAARALAALPEHARPFALTDATGFPSVAAGGGDPIVLFLRIDFLRAWTLADLGLGRLQARLAADPTALLAEPRQLAAQIVPAFDFNRISVGIALGQALLPALPPPARCDDSTAWALRMLGDLALRGRAARQALDCFEAALAIGDNPHRRARARAAAQALDDPGALARHGAAPAQPAPEPAAPEPAAAPGPRP